MMQAASVLGAGPAGLMAAEILSANGIAVTVFDRMASAGRKFLMAGRGGLNLTHSEDFAAFVARYGEAADALRPVLEAFPPAALIRWAEELGQPTFVGSSGRVFPKTMKASPLLRAWLARLTRQGVKFRMRHTWLGWDEGGALLFRNGEGATLRTHAEATILALGGASWPKLGSDGAWARILGERAIALAPFRPANSGFHIPWSEVFCGRFAGAPVKSAQFRFAGGKVRGEAIVTRSGIEGGAIYALSAALRDAIARDGHAELFIDLRPKISAEHLAARIAKPRGKASWTNHLRKAANLSPLETGLLRESGALEMDPAALAAHIKSVRLKLTGTAGLVRSISTAGGIAFAALDEHLMLRAMPGAFVAGEMLDWEAPTGGYLLQASFATGVTAAKGAIAWLRQG
jgi:uncharacterized flavoprotein (TIGR03862 family)